MSEHQPGNGILALVRGEHIASGSKGLPAPGAAEKHQPDRTEELDVPDLGRIRITYRLNTYSHGRSRHWHWHWLAVRADRA